MKIRRNDRPSPNFGGLLLRISATILASLALYLIARATLLATSPQAAAFAASLPPKDYSLELRGLMQAAASPRFRVTPALIDRVRQAAVASPLAYEPFFLMARAEEQANRRGGAIALLEEARRRRPSRFVTRIQLALQYAQSRRHQEALAELDVALSLNDDARSVMLPELTKLLLHPEGREALAESLAREPAWREEFLAVAGAKKVDPRHAEALYEMVKRKKRGGGFDPERGFLLSSLIGVGDIQRARRLWLSSLPKTERLRHAWLFDGELKGQQAPEPFNWALADSDAGRAEIVKGDGQSYLDLRYFGGRNVALAEQTLALPSGEYRFVFFGRSEEGLSSGEVYWSIGCLAGGPNLLNLPIKRLTRTSVRFEKSFSVPRSGCNGQRVSLIAEPGDVARPIEIQVSKLNIVP